MLLWGLRQNEFAISCVVFQPRDEDEFSKAKKKMMKQKHSRITVNKKTAKLRRRLHFPENVKLEAKRRLSPPLLL